MPEVEADLLPDGAVFPADRALPLREPSSPILVVLCAGDGRRVPAAVFRDGEGRLVAIRAECPDLGTRLRPRRTGHIAYWQSAHHGSRFSLDATRILRGPARHLPQRLLVQESEGMVMVRDVAP